MKIKDDTDNSITSESRIIELFFCRDENAIQIVNKQYHKLIFSVCNSILNNYQDSEECTNTVYVKLWNSIPPQKPRSLKAYIIRIARFVSLDRFRLEHRKKRIGYYVIESLDDFSDFLFDDYNIEEELINGELVKALNEFIYSLPKIQQSIFVKRYYYSQSIESIACDDNISSWQVKKNIIDIKKKLRDNLISKELI